MEFVWSDDLAVLLIEEDHMDRSQLTHWLARPIGYRLPETVTALTFGRNLLEQEQGSDLGELRAS